MTIGATCSIFFLDVSNIRILALFDLLISGSHGKLLFFKHSSCQCNFTVLTHWRFECDWSFESRRRFNLVGTVSVLVWVECYWTLWCSYRWSQAPSRSAGSTYVQNHFRGNHNKYVHYKQNNSNTSSLQNIHMRNTILLIIRFVLDWKERQQQYKFQWMDRFESETTEKAGFGFRIFFHFAFYQLICPILEFNMNVQKYE